MHYIIGIISLLFWLVCFKAGLKSFEEGDIDSVYAKEWFSIAYLAIAAWCFH